MDPEKKESTDASSEAPQGQAPFAGTAARVGPVPKTSEERLVPQEVRSAFVKEGVQAAPQSNEPFIDPLRTYEEDVAEAIKRQHSSLVSITAAEQKRRLDDEQPAPYVAPRPPLPWRRIALVGGSIAFVLLGTVVAVGSYFFVRGIPPLPDLPREQAIIFVDEEREVPVDRKSGRDLIETLTKDKDTVSLRIGSVASLLPSEASTSSRRVLSIDELLTRLGAHVESRLVRSFEDHYLLGSHVFDGNQALLIISLNQYDEAFAGMLKWEPAMADDLAPLFGPAPNTWGTSTTGSVAVYTFTDEVVRNHDARVLRDEQGTVRLLYTFPDRNTLVITTNENTLAEILTRITSSRFR